MRYTVSRIECRIKLSQNQRCRAKIPLRPPSRQGVAPFSGPPPSHFPVSFAAGRGPGGGSRRAGGGYRGTFGFRKRIALRGGVAATVTPVALLCATKVTRFSLIFQKKQQNTKENRRTGKGPERKHWPEGSLSIRKAWTNTREATSSLPNCVLLSQLGHQLGGPTAYTHFIKRWHSHDPGRE